MSLKNEDKNKLNKDKPKKKPIYVMTLEFEKGNPEKIEIYSDSNPEYLANYFCKKYNLDYNGIDYLKQKIKYLLEQNKISNAQNKENIDFSNNNNTKSNKNYLQSNNIYTISNKYSSKSKSKISRNEKKIQYIDNKTENINNKRIKSKINQIENIFKNNNEQNTYMNNNIKKIKKPNNSKKSQYIKKEKEKDIVQELFPYKTEIINYYKNKNINLKNKKNKKYQKIFISKSYKNISKENNICTRISKEYDRKFSFHPVINQNYKTDLTFEERQKFYKNLYIKRKKELNQFYLNKKKDENGHLLFKPYLIRAKNYNNEKNNFEEDIFQKNYLAYKKYDLNREKLLKKYYQNIPEKNKENNTKKVTDKIVSKNKMRAFNNLFNALDSDQDGIISRININIINIENNILNIIQPLLFELKEENLTLNKKEFVTAMNKLFEDISLIQKGEIINKYKTMPRKNKSLDITNSYNSYKLNHSSNFNFFMNNNTNKLANNHYNKIMKYFDSLSKKRNSNNLTKENKTEINFNKSSDIYNNISKYTFNNYINNLNLN